MSTPYQVGIVCTGNICRSPIGEVVLKDLLAREGLGDLVNVTSAGTAGWHVGEEMDPRAQNALRRAGFHGSATLAQLADSAYVDARDLVIVMTKEHQAEIVRRRTRPSTQVELLRNFNDPGLNLDVADPYYGTDEDFDACVAQISRGLERWTSEFRHSRGWSNEV